MASLYTLLKQPTRFHCAHAHETYPTTLTKMISVSSRIGRSLTVFDKNTFWLKTNGIPVGGPVPINDMEWTSLNSDQIGVLFQKVAQCSETYEKTIFWFLRFLVFETWSMLYSNFLEYWQTKRPTIAKNIFLPKRFASLIQKR